MDRLAALLTLPLLPAWWAASALHPRWRPDFSERWGLSVPPVQPGALWLHGASVGELAGAEALLPHLSGPVLLTADTDDGAVRARALVEGRPGFAGGRKPADHLLALAPWWAEARPRLVVFLEGTFWPVLAARARRAGVPVVRVSARIGPRTARWERWVRRLGEADRVFARDERALAAFLARGVPTELSGDLKSERPVGPPVLSFSRPFAVGASLRTGDARRFLQVTDALDLAAVVAPRHPDRFDLAELGQRPFVRRTALSDGRVPPGVSVVLVDTLGELHRCHQGARFVFVGGTFDETVGGHSPWDAARVGAPVVAGPHVFAQGQAFALVRASIAADGDLLAAALRAVPPPVPPPVAGPLAARLAVLAGPPAPESSPRPWLAPLGPGVAAGARLRRWWVTGASVGAPVISVGSTNARSPGRTSTVRALVALLLADGHRVGVVCRGYRRSRAGPDVRIGVDAADVGDEGALLAGCGALVAAGPDRAEAARRLVAAGATVVLLDDGLQAFAVRRDLEIVVVDARFPNARGMLPAGERRERRAVPRRAQLVLVHHGDGRFAFPGHRVERRPTGWRRGEDPVEPSGACVVFTGLGRGADLLATLDVAVRDRWLLRDHEAPDPERLLAWAGGATILCTAKDRVRLPPELRDRVVWRDVDLELPEEVRERVSRVAAG